MTVSRDRVKDKLGELKQTFSSQLPGKVKQIEDSIAALDREGWDPGLAEASARLIHALAGTAGTFGFTEISAASKSLEKILKRCIRDGIAPSGSDSAEIGRHVAVLKGSAAGMDRPAPVNETGAGLHAAVSSESASVYLFDSDSAFADTLALQLRYYGYKTEVFGTPEEIIGALKKSPPLLAVIEMALLNEDQHSGSGMLAEFRRVSGSSPGIVFLSDRRDFRSRMQAVRSGGIGYFVKPLDAGRLVDCLDKLTRGSHREPFRILIIDDEPLLTEYHAAVLQHAGMEVAVVTDPQKSLETLSDFRPELILMDLYMPECNGLELANVIRHDETYIDIPIVFLSAETDIDKQLRAMSLGGDDFLTKPIRADHLISSVSSRAERYRGLRTFMIRDSLTGLLNHSRTKEQLDIETSKAERNRGLLAFAIIDIDHFKSVNDTYGHHTGDQVIKGLSRLLQQRLRKTDTVGRYGGEEFAVILSEMDSKGAMQILDSIRQDFGRIRYQSKDKSFSVTFSCGIASFPDFKTAGELHEAADAALYRAKSSGRNVICLS